MSPQCEMKNSFTWLKNSFTQLKLFPGKSGRRACVDQLLITIRSFTLLCNQSRSKTRLITIMKLIAKLGIIYATACHASLCTTALDCLSVRCHCCRTALTTIYKHRTGRGSVKVCWLPLIASRNTPRLPSPNGRLTDRRDRLSTLVSHCQHSGRLR